MILIYGVPIYIICNATFLILNLIFAFIFLTKKNTKIKNEALFDFKRGIAFYIFINELFFLFALYFWYRSGMDGISWGTDWMQQLLYIISENSKSIFRFIILLGMHGYEK